MTDCNSFPKTARQETIDIVKARFEATAIERERVRACGMTGDPEVKRAVLEVPATFQDTAATILKRAQWRVDLARGIRSQEEIERWHKEYEERRMMEDDHMVWDFIQATRTMKKATAKFFNTTRPSNLTPEEVKALRLVKCRINKLIRILEADKTALEGVK